MKIGLNTSVTNKVDFAERAQSLAFASAWTQDNITSAELLTHIARGHAYGPCFKNGKREAASFIETSVLSVDIDKGWLFEDLIANQFVQQHAAFVYTTFSHSPAQHRMRIVFALDQPITVGADARDATIYLMKRFHDADESCKDIGRCFYGSKNCQHHTFGNVLSTALISDFIAEQRALKNAPHQGAPHGVLNRPARMRSAVRLDANQQVIDCNGVTRALATFSGGDGCHCPMHADTNPSALVVKNVKGKHGIFCHACATTFWPERETEMPRVPRDPSFEFFNKYIVPLTQAHECDQQNAAPNFNFIHKQYGYEAPHTRFLGDAEVVRDSGLVLIRSPKGTNKSGLLADIVDPSAVANRNLKVLLLGHRKTLLRELSKRLKLDYYDDPKVGSLPTDRYAVTVNSLPTKFFGLRPPKYDIVIIDEAEQVIATFFADTLKKNRQRVISLTLQFIRGADRLLLADADLGTCLEPLLKATNRMMDIPSAFVVLNESRADIHGRLQPSRPKVHLYQDRNELIDDLMETFHRGQKVFACLNSKARAEELHEAMRCKAGCGAKTLLVTQDTLLSPEVQDFLSEPKAKFWQYDAVVSSPTLGSGIDISYPTDDVPPVHVYGLFEPGITTHLEMDQHLARVRNPVSTKVWICPATFRYETDVECIKQELISTDLEWAVTSGLDEFGDVVFKDSPIAELFGVVESARRSSLSNPLAHFKSHKLRDGWAVVDVPKSEVPTASTTKADLKKARESNKDRKRSALLDARTITPDEAHDLILKRQSRSRISETEQVELDKHFLADFFQQPVDVALFASIDPKSRGDYKKLQQGIKSLELLLTPVDQLLYLDKQEGRRLPIDRVNRVQIAGIYNRLLLACGLEVLMQGDYPVGWTGTARALATFAKAVDACTPSELKLIGIKKKRADLFTSPMNTLQALLSALGLETTRISAKNIKGGKKLYTYCLNRDRFDFVMGSVQRRAKHREVSLISGWLAGEQIGKRVGGVETSLRPPICPVQESVQGVVNH